MSTFTLINASAGSGKTYTLTREIAQRVAEGLDPSQLIATTFTVKAAAELRDRVRRTLLEGGQLDAARGVDSALISTVNSVSGELLREFALDAGISPDVQVLDEDRQKDAFRAAIDETAAAAGTRAADLLARTEHDGEEEPDLPYGASPSWRAHVRALASRARTNLLGADALRDAIEPSFAEYAAAALPASEAEDRRPAWRDGIASAIEALWADVRSSEAGDGPFTVAGAGTVRKHLSTLEAVLRSVSDPDRAPWSAWARIAKVAEPRDKGYAYVKNVDAALLGIARTILEELPANPALHRDIHDLVALVMGTAAESLEAYQTFKDELGLIDFIDQEVRTLELLRSSDRAREVIRSRFRLLAVDEFQDTSPVQLALFLELSSLVEHTIWVGDPKQAIYGFRDADPQLMLEIIARIEAGAAELGAAEVKDLAHSWRSQEQVLSLVDAVFPRVFPDLPRERVVTTAAPGAIARRAADGHRPGRLEAWTPSVPKSLTYGQHATAIADGILTLLTEEGASPAEIAVLVRSNCRAEDVIAALTARGIPASGEGAPLLATREGRLVRAALAVTLDLSDTLALTELVDLLPDHPAHGTWFADLAAQSDRTARTELFASWWRAPVLDGLRALREGAISLTPVEMITAVIDALDLPERLRSWSCPDQRLRTLDALRAVAAEYAEQARATSSPITLTGLRIALDAVDRGPDLTGTPDTVWVGTIHGAKGLEWPHVVVMLDHSPTVRAQTSGAFVVPAETLDVSAPLAGRSPRYWPEVLPRFGPLQEGLEASAHAQRRARSEREESGRLQYVALTRAADVTVLSGPGTAPVLDLLVPGEEPLLSWSAGADGIAVRGEASLPAVMRSPAGVLEDGPAGFSARRTPLAATDLTGPRVETEQVRARFQASGVASAEDLGTVHAPRTIGRRLVTNGGPQWERVGEAIHAYLALPLAHLSEAQKASAAQRLVERWAVTRAVGSEMLQEAGQAWASFVADEFPGAEELTEQPISWWNEEDQVMEGWIDTLLRLPSGEIVLVDHKTYPGDHPVEHVREKYLGQLTTYSRALAASGIAPSQVLIHLPLRGEVLEVSLRG
ncbi:UvrD-helicase domain-containing protein [Brachybacterium aquaticum]|uniref:DNA 3'-5' helicase n=1 Tax=Brachybacterium aquaticum TaxID=1432564 RepID=A0A841AHA4_9MICO|nr:UvrD-helicase domain-containing protein [Brachybacterium aquaticum]MBB5832454.1 ATP-dependent exoDNAse (exonuclease V) beta subunit [Brachybacterium aquaticum]